MKKIIAAFDGLKYSESTSTYAVQIAKGVDAHLVGIFLDDPLYTSYKIYDLVANGGVSEKKLKRFDRIDANKRKKAAELFESVCDDAGINFSVHHDRGFALQDLIHESAYADLLIIDADETFGHHDEKQPTRFIRDVLADSHCPVMLVPHKYTDIEKVVLLYDGEPSAVYAIKMFSYLLPQFKNLKPHLLSIKMMNQSSKLPDNALMKEFMSRHFPKVDYKVIKGFADTEILKTLKSFGPNVLVVLGAYQRSGVSRWFHESMADTLLRETKLALFIAHQ